MGTFVYQPVSRVLPSKNEMSPHWFGGRPGHKGAHPRGYPLPLHLLYDFDTTDPLFPVKLTNARRLPIYYGFPYNGGAVGYSVTSDMSIVVHYMETKEAGDFPYPGYPDAFPRTPVALDELSYEDQRILAFQYFVEQPQSGLDLSPRDRRRLRKLSFPFTQLGGVHIMWQDIPTVPCPNPKCPTQKKWPMMDVFAVVWNWPVPGVALWDPSEKDHDVHGCDVQIICQICRRCSAIHVCNRCT